MLVKFVLSGLKASEVPVAVGVFLLGWTIFTAYMTVASFRVSGAVVAVFVLLTATFVLLTIGAFESSVGVTKTGGWLGIATAAAAWYASFAGVVNETFKRTIVPVGAAGPAQRPDARGRTPVRLAEAPGPSVAAPSPGA